MKINNLIKYYRMENKLTQQELGNMLDVSQDTISLWEKGKAIPNYSSLKKMCVIFDISGDEILEIETTEQRKSIHINNSFNNNNGKQNINIK